VVFEGKIVAVSGPITSGSWPAGHVKLKVSRVWKGNVPSSFEMPAIVEGGSCLGFYPSLLRPNNEILVYARRVAWTPKGEKGYLTDACARTQLLQNAREDLAILPAISERDRARQTTRQMEATGKD
jgi:hypothetical protein